MGDLTGAGDSPEAGEIRGLLANLESTDVEFKSSLRYDFATGGANRALTKAVAKTLAGFLNVAGGTLVIGVSDDRHVVGIQRDLETLSRRDLDSFERALRGSVGGFLGAHIGPALTVTFVDIEGETVVKVACGPYGEPVFLSEGDRPEFYIRDGNQTVPLNVRATHDYIRGHWPSESPATPESVREVVSELLREQFAHMQPEVLRDMIHGAFQEARVPAPPPTVGEVPPTWLKVSTRRVLDLFLSPLARSPGWKRLYLISPWISDIHHSASLTFDQFLKRIKDDGTTAYVVTRPPVEDWHESALARLGETGRVNIALVPELHIKLYSATTEYGSFAMLGSANFTQQGLLNREIGLLVNAHSDGKRLVSELTYEAAQLYRLPERQLVYRASFSMS